MKTPKNIQRHPSSLKNVQLCRDALKDIQSPQKKQGCGKEFVLYKDTWDKEQKDVIVKCGSCYFSKLVLCQDCKNKTADTNIFPEEVYGNHIQSQDAKRSLKKQNDIQR